MVNPRPSLLTLRRLGWGPITLVRPHGDRGRFQRRYTHVTAEESKKNTTAISERDLETPEQRVLC